jgi:hypothetical protein
LAADGLIGINLFFSAAPQVKLIGLILYLAQPLEPTR